MSMFAVAVGVATSGNAADGGGVSTPRDVVAIAIRILLRREEGGRCVVLGMFGWAILFIVSTVPTS
jgi:hypothetical protein